MTKKDIFSLSGAFLSIVVLVLALLYLQERRPSEKEGAIPSFEKKENEEGYNLSYRWLNFEKKTQAVSFSISKRSLAEADEEFGFRERELNDYLREISSKLEEEAISRLKGAALELVKRSPYSNHIQVEERDPQSFNLKLSAPSGLQEKVGPEFERLKLQLEQQREALAKKNERELADKRRSYLEEKGLRVLGDKLGIDYGFCIRHNRERLKDAFEAMRMSGENINLRQFLGQLLSFIQAIKYGLPPLQEGDRFILEFWVPPKVLVNNLGDCDSKGVAFSALWTNFKRFPLLVIKMPKHMVIGLAIPALGEEGLYINGVRYTLLEVTGPERMPPGLITPYSQFYLEGKRFSYELIR